MGDARLAAADVAMPLEPGEEGMAEAIDKASKEVKDLRPTAPDKQVPNPSDEELEET